MKPEILVTVEMLNVRLQNPMTRLNLHTVAIAVPTEDLKRDIILLLSLQICHFALLAFFISKPFP